MRRACVPRPSPATAMCKVAIGALPSTSTPPVVTTSSIVSSPSDASLSCCSSLYHRHTNTTFLSNSTQFGSVQPSRSRSNHHHHPLTCQRRGMCFQVTCETTTYKVPPARHIKNRESIQMHPMVRKFVDGVLNSEPTSLVYNEKTKVCERPDGTTPIRLNADWTIPDPVVGDAELSKSEKKQSPKKKTKVVTSDDYDHSIVLSDAVAGPLKTGNLLLSGMEGTGKRTNMILAGEELERQGKRVSWISGDFFRVHSLGAVYMHYFFGLRVGDGLPIMEQMVGMFRRHAIILETTFEKMIPSLVSTDVLIFDSIQHANANIIKAFDRVCRELRQQPNLPFGGIKVLACANFWRLLRVSPASDYSGYTFQMQEMDKWFDHFYLTNVHHQKDTALKILTHKATMGELTVQDCKQLEQLSSAESSHPMAPTPMVDYAPALRVLAPPLCKHPGRRVIPAKVSQLRRTDFGNFLCNILTGPFSYANTLRLPDKATYEPGTPVHLVYATETVPVGEHGIVESVGEANITVNFPRLRQSIPIPMMRFRISHTDYPEIAVTVNQFPLQNRTVTSGKFLVHGEQYWNIQIDGLYLTETNHLGLFLNKMRTFKDFQATNMDKYMKLEGMVHEATRVYCRELMAAGRSDTQIVMKGDEWCRNCKTHVPAEKFFAHWKQCLKQLRWCGDCNRAIPLSKYASHREKHQIVMCIDCAQPVEWRNWELHRLTCAPMMREISSENELLPERTRQVAMQYGLDRRDLHTVKRIVKSNLPNARAGRRGSKKSLALSETGVR